MAKTYLYIFKDGKIRKTGNRPTPHQLECIADGTLHVLLVNIHDGFPDDPWEVQADGDIEQVPDL